MNRRPGILATVLIALVGIGCDRPTVPLPTANPSVPTPPVEPVKPAAVQFLPAAASVAWTPVTTCNLEQVDAQAFAGAPIVVKKGAEFLLTGFMFSERSQSVPGTVRVRAINADNTQAWEAPVTGRYERLDVPGYFKIGDWALQSGLEQLISTHGLPPGTFHLLFLFDEQGKTFVCDNGRQLTVAP